MLEGSEEYVGREKIERAKGDWKRKEKEESVLVAVLNRNRSMRRRGKVTIADL